MLAEIWGEMNLKGIEQNFKTRSMFITYQGEIHYSSIGFVTTNLVLGWWSQVGQALLTLFEMWIIVFSSADEEVHIQGQETTGAKEG